MSLGEQLVQANLVSAADVEQALDRQKLFGGTIGHNMIMNGAITEEQLHAFLRPSPPMLRSLSDTGLDRNFLLDLALKIMYHFSLRSAAEIAQEMKLPAGLIRSLLQLGMERQLLDSRGVRDASLTGEFDYGLTRRGRDWVNEAFERSQYIGPAPVPLENFVEQVQAQRITNDRIEAQALDAAIAHLVLPGRLRTRIGPAVNSGRALLLHGPPGNGKTALATAMAQSFQHTIFVPYALVVDRQVIKVFDPAIHHVVAEQPLAEEPQAQAGRPSLRLRALDQRWVPCRRPVAMAGGELTMDMLELRYQPLSNFYDAPLQLKAAGGVIVLDDFGRQKAAPLDILNRWLRPLEVRVDFMTLNTGKTFRVPFDSLVILATNLPIDTLFDDAVLRRFAYKLHIDAPTAADYRNIFERACRRFGIPFEAGVVDRLIAKVYQDGNRTMAAYHPDFLVEHIVARCRYEGVGPRLDDPRVDDAVEQLFGGFEATGPVMPSPSQPRS